ncbi:MAG: hypothetical protein QM638_09555 [Nocardioides sp.]|uniref:hypothetical protein n=1 Tax=Nocardioides sp. TaxID=35761 RepID=UPI0039E5B7E2
MTTRRTRVAALATATAVIVTGVSIASGAPAQAADGPTADCATAFPEADLVKDQTVHGLTVTSGTTPSEFTGTVLGVLKGGISASTDMIVMELHSDEIDEAGIWEGMSGSPVYDDTTGELIGAVSYTLSYGETQIAGVTPFAAMQKYLPDGGSTAGSTGTRDNVRVQSSALAHRIADAAGITQAQAAKGFSQLQTPVSVAGVSAKRVDQAADSDDKALHSKVAAGRLGVSAEDESPGADSLVAGGNLAAAYVYGDVAMAGIGTVTSVCDGGLVGFGHPMDGTGTTSLALLTADAVTIQPDNLNASFKVANLGQVAGIINQDRTPAIAGPLGAGPRVGNVTATSTYDGTSRTGTSYVANREYTADAVFYETVNNSDAITDTPYLKGGSLATYVVKGTENGKAFSLTYADRFVSGGDITSETAYPAADLAYALSLMKGVTITSVTAKAGYNDNTRSRKITTVQQKRSGTWVTVGKKPITAKPGGTVTLRVTTSGTGVSTKKQTFSFKVSKRLKGAIGELDVVGGNANYLDAYGDSTIAKVKKTIAETARHDQVQTNLYLRKHGVNGNREIKLPKLDTIVKGHKYITVKVSK